MNESSKGIDKDEIIRKEHSLPVLPYISLPPLSCLILISNVSAPQDNIFLE